MTSADDVFDGFFIPKGTVVLPNVWYATFVWPFCGWYNLLNRAIAFEPNPLYDPEQFIPERFLDEKVKTVDPATWAFGFGRR